MDHDAYGPTRRLPGRRRPAWRAARRGPLISVSPAAATPNSMDAAIRHVVGEAEVRDGKVRIDVPPLVENGNTVPMTVAVDSPMTPADHVSEHLHLQRKEPAAQRGELSSRAARRQGRVSTRIRLADSQKVVAIAQLSDGSFWSESADVIVTIAACVEGT